jgi:hypothetical protein
MVRLTAFAKAAAVTEGDDADEPCCEPGYDYAAKARRVNPFVPESMAG